MSVNYSEAQINELKKHEGNYNFEIAKIFADKHDIPVRSVVAKIKSLELPYEIQTARGKKVTNKPVKRTKASIVDAINTETGLDMRSLVNMTINDLELLEGYFKALAEAE